ncbi:uncharacterized protein LOC113992431 isoform X4 [Pipra filicauda]|uniref:Uncharacterized protein LOC113992431 isoform X4 n=1 Tax=Pipra filicauda TaxID=649802 RepID=A0A7R5L7Z5_9PASS|nr:uncharacterized protein LOC113992431 isoform X4 [Pipra filicauda]
MEPQDKGKSDESLSEKNRDLLRLEAQEKRRREAPGEKDQFPGKTPIFAKPYKTDNKDALSRRIRNVLGDYNDFKEYMRKNLRKVIWFPKKIKSRSQTRSNCREPSSRQTKTFQSSVTEQPLKNSKTSESSELEPFLEKTNSTDAPSIEDILREMTFTISRPVSPLQSPPKADPSSTKQTNSTDALSIEDILREMTFTISRPVSPLQSPPKAEPSSTKDTDGSAAQNQGMTLEMATETVNIHYLEMKSSLAQAQEHCRALSPEHPCSWTTCSSVTVRRAMTTKLLKSLLLHLFLQETEHQTHHLKPRRRRAAPTTASRDSCTSCTKANRHDPKDTELRHS